MNKCVRHTYKWGNCKGLRKAHMEYMSDLIWRLWHIPQMRVKWSSDACQNHVKTCKRGLLDIIRSKKNDEKYRCPGHTPAPGHSPKVAENATKNTEVVKLVMVSQDMAAFFCVESKEKSPKHLFFTTQKVVRYAEICLRFESKLTESRIQLWELPNNTASLQGALWQTR